MNKMYHRLFLLVWAIAFAGCTQKQSENPAPIDENQTDSIVVSTDSTEHAKFDEYRKRVVKLPRRENEESLKVKLIPGVTMLTDDCNSYGLQGEFEEHVDDETNTVFRVFRSDRNVFQTQMGCPDDTMIVRFVAGQSVLTDYNSSQPLVVYLPQNIELQTEVWRVSDMVSVNKNEGEAIMRAFPADHLKRMGDVHGYALQLSGISADALIQLIPGITKKVDCNHHWIKTNGFGRAGTIEFPYEYYIYDSDGEVFSTRMACPDNTLTEKFIHDRTPYTFPYNPDEPIVFFIPAKLELRYRIWEKA